MSSEAPTAPVEKASRLRALTAERRALEANLGPGGGPGAIKNQPRQGKRAAGQNLPYQGGVFPGQDGAARIFYYNSIMRRYLRVPQIAAVMGPCVAGGAYLPALSDIIIMVEKTSFMGLGGANLVKGATGQTIDNETLGGARTHTEVSGVAHYREESDESCVEKIREIVSELPASEKAPASVAESREAARSLEDLYEIIPE